MYLVGSSLHVAKGELWLINATPPADMSLNESSDSSEEDAVNFPDGHRLVNSNLAGGALLDLGVYSLAWVFQVLYHLQPESEKEAPVVLAASNKYKTGVDETTSIICHFPEHKAMGLATTSIRVGTSPHHIKSSIATLAVRIQGSRGEIQIRHPAGRPLGYSIITTDGDGEAQVVDCPVPEDVQKGAGHGMFWQADECARCLRAGLTESSMMPWAESIAVMDAIEAALKQGGIVYPEQITTVNTGEA